MKAARIILAVLCFVLFGCDSDRISRLEKQNRELQEQLKKQETSASLELQAKCSRDARLWFHENWSRDKDTTLLDFTNHYNKEMNKCFIMVEYHYSIGNISGSWMNNISMWDVYENTKYAQFSESHLMAKDFMKVTDEIISCNPPTGNECKSIQEFNNALSSYMSN